MRHARNSTIKPDTIEYGGFLVIDAHGAMRLTRQTPPLAPGERSVKLQLKVPRALFRTPSLMASITIPPDTAPPEITAETVSAVENALRAGTGLDFCITVGGA